MARLSARARPDRERVLHPARQLCPGCGGHMRLRYENRRTLVLLTGAVRLRLQIRRCEREGCARYHPAYRPEAEGAIALPQHEFGLDVIALVGVLRHREHRSAAWCTDRLAGAEELSGVGERPLSCPLDADRAVQAQPGPPPPYSTPAAHGHELAGLRRQLTAAWQPGSTSTPCFGNMFWFKPLRGRAWLLASHGMVRAG